MLTASFCLWLVSFSEQGGRLWFSYAHESHEFFFSTDCWAGTCVSSIKHLLSGIGLDYYIIVDVADSVKNLPTRSTCNFFDGIRPVEKENNWLITAVPFGKISVEFFGCQDCAILGQRLLHIQKQSGLCANLFTSTAASSSYYRCWPQVYFFWQETLYSDHNYSQLLISMWINRGLILE